MRFNWARICSCLLIKLTVANYWRVKGYVRVTQCFQKKTLSFQDKNIRSGIYWLMLLWNCARCPKMLVNKDLVANYLRIWRHPAPKLLHLDNELIMVYYAGLEKSNTKYRIPRCQPWCGCSLKDLRRRRLGRLLVPSRTNGTRKARWKRDWIRIPS